MNFKQFKDSLVSDDICDEYRVKFLNKYTIYREHEHLAEEQFKYENRLEEYEFYTSHSDKWDYEWSYIGNSIEDVYSAIGADFSQLASDKKLQLNDDSDYIYKNYVIGDVWSVLKETDDNVKFCYGVYVLCELLSDERKQRILKNYFNQLFKEILEMDTNSGNEIELKDISKGDLNDMKLFISHKSEDGLLIDGFVDLLLSIGFSEKNLIYTTRPGYGIPLGTSIYEYLKKSLNDNVVIIYMLSNNYYKSPACLNEMGGAWVNSSKGYAFMLPLFTHQKIEGAIDPRAIAARLDDSAKLTELKNELIDHFNLRRISDVIWEQNKEKYLIEYEAKKEEYNSKFNHVKFNYHNLDYDNNTLLYRLTNYQQEKIKFREMKMYFRTKSGIEEIEIINNSIIYPEENRIESYQLDKDVLDKIIEHIDVRSTFNYISLP